MQCFTQCFTYYMKKKRGSPEYQVPTYVCIFLSGFKITVFEIISIGIKLMSNWQPHRYVLTEKKKHRIIVHLCIGMLPCMSKFIPTRRHCSPGNIQVRTRIITQFTCPMTEPLLAFHGKIHVCNTQDVYAIIRKQLTLCDVGVFYIIHNKYVSVKNKL